MKRSTHNAVIKLGLALGYPIDDKGCCQGFTLKWLEACFINQETQFIERVQKISPDEDVNEPSLLKSSRDPTSLTSEEIHQLLDNKDGCIQYQDKLFYFNARDKKLTDVSEIENAVRLKSLLDELEIGFVS